MQSNNTTKENIMNNTTDRITLLESTDGDIRITANEQRIFIVTPFNAAFKDQLKARFGARWNGSTKEWSIAFRYRDELDPLLYDYFGVSMIAEVTTPSLMKVAIDAQRLYQVSGAGMELAIAGSRVAARWGRDEAVRVYRGTFKKDGEDFKMPRSGGSMRRPRVADGGELKGVVLETEITPAEMDWLRENEVNFELLDGGKSDEASPEDPQLDPEDLNDLHADDETWMEDDEDDDRIYVQQEEDNETEAEVEVNDTSDEDEEDKEMKNYHVKADGSMGVCKAQDGSCPFGEAKHFTNESEAQAYAEKLIKSTTDHNGGLKMKKNLTDGDDFMSIDPIVVNDKEAMEMETKMNEERTAETKAKSFTTPTNEAVVKAWENFAKRVAEVDDPDTEVEIERGSRQVFGIGGAGDIIRGIELRKDRPTMEDDLDAWMKVSAFTGDVFPRFVNPDDDRALLLVDEWNDLMDSIANDEDETTPEIRQAAEDQKIVALGRQNGSVIGMEVYDDGADMDEILNLRESNGSATVLHTHTTPAGVHVAVYPGWNGDDEIIWAGGYVDGSFVRPDEVDRACLFDKLSEDVRAELEPLAGGNPEDWNGKILEMQDDVDPKDAELLEALWIGEEVYGGEVTVYGTDDDVTHMDEDDFEILGLSRTYQDLDDALGR